jgi:tRNA uridine 5-carbamoylmethylation protein Kti12
LIDLFVLFVSGKTITERNLKQIVRKGQSKTITDRNLKQTVRKDQSKTITDRNLKQTVPKGLFVSGFYLLLFLI